MGQEKNTARPTGTSSAEVIQVIQTMTVVGKGTDENPLRYLKQFWSLDGKLLAVDDPELRTS